MKFVLIVLLSAKAGSGMSLYHVPAMSMATFDDKPACEAAAEEVRRLERRTSLELARIATACMPVASDGVK